MEISIPEYEGIRKEYKITNGNECLLKSKYTKRRRTRTEGCSSDRIRIRSRPLGCCWKHRTGREMLGRQALRGLIRSLGSAPRNVGHNARRSFADAPAPAAATAGHEDFIAAWKKVAPNIEPPKTPLTFMKPRPPVPGAIPSKVTVNFVLPYQVELSSKEVDMIIIPATTGQMGVLPGHVATIAELKPGILSVHEGNDVKKYFISSGFAFIHANSYTDIIAVEAVPMDNIDPTLVQKGLAEYTQKLSSASTDLEKAEAQIGIEVHSSLNAALSG